MSKCSLVFITDDNYAMPTAVAIESAKQNKSPQTELDVRIIGVDLCAENHRKLLQLGAENVSVTLVDPGDTSRFDNVEQRTHHVSKSALFKFELANLLNDLDKVLYLDGDILIQADLAELFATDLGDALVGAVPDAAADLVYDPRQLTRLGLEDHEFYFNSGVMLLNLAQMRREQIGEKLLDYRLNGLNYFMDQDALNAVMGKRARWLSVRYNYITNMLSRVTAFELQTLYQEKIPSQSYAAYRKAAILHFASPSKPWVYDKPYLSLLFQQYYALSPYGDVPLLFRREESTDKEKAVQAKKESKVQNALAHFLDECRADEFWNNHTGYLLNREETRSPKIVVSLTTFPARIMEVRKTLVPIFDQTLKPDRVLLCLSREEFPGLERDLPAKLLELRDRGLEICWGENLRAHTKYFEAMTQNPDDIIITIDDDIRYSNDLVEKLFASYQKHPRCVSALRTHLITFADDGCLAPYNSWRYQSSELVDTPSLLLLATGVGGVLYPPHLLPPETFDREAIRKYCLRADDIWLKFMEMKAGIPVVLAQACEELSFVGNTQTVGLCYDNVDLGGNDACIYNMFYAMPESIVWFTALWEQLAQAEPAAAAASLPKRNAGAGAKSSRLSRLKKKILQIFRKLSTDPAVKRWTRDTAKRTDSLLRKSDQLIGMNRKTWKLFADLQAQIDAQDRFLLHLAKQQEELLALLRDKENRQP